MSTADLDRLRETLDEEYRRWLLQTNEEPASAHHWESCRP